MNQHTTNNKKSTIKAFGTPMSKDEVCNEVAKAWEEIDVYNATQPLNEGIIGGVYRWIKNGLKRSFNRVLQSTDSKKVIRYM